MILNRMGTYVGSGCVKILGVHGRPLLVARVSCKRPTDGIPMILTLTDLVLVQHIHLALGKNPAKMCPVEIDRFTYLKLHASLLV